MKAIELLEWEKVNLIRQIEIVERNECQVMTNIPHNKEMEDLADIEKAIKILKETPMKTLDSILRNPPTKAREKDEFSHICDTTIDYEKWKQEIVEVIEGLIPLPFGDEKCAKCRSVIIRRIEELLR